MSWKKNSVKSIRHIRLRHCFSIDVGLRLHGVPVLGAPPGIVPFNLHHLSQCCFWSVPLPSPLRRPHECRSTLIRFLFFQNLADPVPAPSPNLTTGVFCLCHLQNCLVKDILLPSYLQNSSKVRGLKGVYSLFLGLGQLLGLTSIYTAIWTGPGS